MRIFLFCFLFYCVHIKTVYAANIDCTIHPIYCSIVKLNPRVERTHAIHLSNLMHRYAKQFKMDPFDSVAIAMQENAFRDYSPRVHILTDQREVVSGMGDIGVFQINVRTALDYGLDPRKLLSSLEYQVMSHFKILRKKTAVCRALGLIDQAVACYHSYTPFLRARYHQKIMTYRNQIGIK